MFPPIPGTRCCHLLVVGVILVAMTFPPQVVAGGKWYIPRFYKRLLGNTYGHEEEAAPEPVDAYYPYMHKCLPLSARCNPWSVSCCHDMECLSHRGDTCSSPLDQCACYPHTYRIRTASHDLWYRRRR